MSFFHEPAFYAHSVITSKYPGPSTLVISMFDCIINYRILIIKSYTKLYYCMLKIDWNIPLYEIITCLLISVLLEEFLDSENKSIFHIFIKIVLFSSLLKCAEILK